MLNIDITSKSNPYPNMNNPKTGFEALIQECSKSKSFLIS